jgi:ribulose-phosphate 3-epimerase
MIPWFLHAGADIITIHVEAEKLLHRALQQIHEAGRKAGVV